MMKALCRVLAALLLAAWVPIPNTSESAWAAQKTHVKGYTKKDGTHVEAHERKAPQPKLDKPKTSGASGGRTATKRGAASSVPRDARGRIARSETAKHAFEIQTGYPNGRPGYVIDHIVPLACGGADAPTNMQWQTLAEAKAKDRVERKGCGS